MMFSRRIIATLRHQQHRNFASTASRRADFTHAVIGAGAVGLAIARRLQKVDGAQVVLIEKHGMVGSETSSRNSEVIHAGIYYGKDTLKTNLCLEGKKMLYDLCEQYEIPHINCGKWIVAQNDEEMQALQGVHEHCQSIGVPMRFISKDEAQEREPSVRAAAGALESPTTGILDSHSYMQFLEGDFEEAGGVDLIVLYNSGRFRMAGRGSLAGLLPFADANAIVIEMANEVLPVSSLDLSSQKRGCSQFYLFICLNS